MKTVNLNTEESQVKWWAARDARQRNLNNKSHWAYDLQTRAERMKLVLELVYRARDFYIAYGKRAISIKVDHGLVSDRVLLKEIEQDWAARGVIKKVSPQGVIYSFTS